MELGLQTRRFDHAERGQVLPIVALSLVVMLGAATMAVDVGYLRYIQRIQQSAADSAAIAGAAEIGYPSAGDIAVAAKADAGQNGFTDDGTNTIVVVNHPPATGPYTGNANAVEVTVRAKHPMFFERILGAANQWASQWVAARAVAMFGNGNGAGNCIYALESDVDINASTINAPACGIIDNGILNANGSTITAASFGVVGQINTNASTYAEASPKHALAGTDPCPTITACNALATSPPATSPCDHSNLNLNAWTGTLYPGVYCQSVNMNASNVTFAPGLYVWAGGLNVNSTSLYGTGVTFYVATNSLNVNAAAMNLTAPTSGTYTGILVFQPSSNTSSANLNASGSSTVEGAVYLPTGTLTTNATFNTWMLIVAGIVHMNSSNVTLPANAGYPGMAPHVYLAE